MKTAVELLWQSAARLPDHLALAEDGGERRLTYGELTAEIETLAAGLSALGVRPGDRFATVMPGSLDLILTLFALSRIGAIPALINPRLKPEEVGKLLAQGGMKGALIGSGVAAVDAAAKALPAGTLLLVPGAGTGWRRVSQRVAATREASSARRVRPRTTRHTSSTPPARPDCRRRC